MEDKPQIPIQKLLDYLAIEAPGGDKLTADDLDYIGCTKTNTGPVWAWQFKDAFGTSCYVTAEPYEESFLLGYSERPPADL